MKTGVSWLLCLSFLLSCADGLQIRQCTCGEITPCESDLKQIAKECVNKQNCVDILSDIGDKDEVLACMTGKEDTIIATRQCVVDKIDQGCTNSESTIMIEKLTKEEAEKRAKAEEDEARNKYKNAQFVQTGRKSIQVLRRYRQCVQSCIQDRTTSSNCYENLGCQLKQQEKTEVREATEQCARANGRQEMAAEQCNCLVQAAATDLQDSCIFIRAFGRRGRGRGK